jgi:single-stranded-DNA-specific exonuclease
VNYHSRESILWQPSSYDEAFAKKIEGEFKIHPASAAVLAGRGFTTLEQIHDFLYAKLPDLHDPDLFQDMDKAVERVFKALEKKEKILIYGDNDVDGITATTLLTEFFELLGATVFAYISNRSSPQKSLLLDAVEYATQKGCTLLITVDCGITAASEIEEATSRHIDVIVSDHHEPTAPLPHSVATLNPKLLNSTYPNRDITGVGVAFKLAHAITNRLIDDGKIGSGSVNLERYLDLVALGTIADMATLLGENRILVRYGLKQLRKNRRIGLAKLCHLAEVKPSEITPLEIASKVAPPLNSLGRIADPNKGVALLLCKDSTAAEILAKELEQHNTDRQKIERRDSADIDHYLSEHPEELKAKAIVLYSPKWHGGIIPIITARIAKQYNRPTLIIAIEGGIGKGSLRTISEFPLLTTLKEHSSLLLNFGGHDFAAGLTIKAENIEQLKTLFLQSAETALKDLDIRPKLHVDARVSLKDLSFDFMESLSLLEPFGNGNSPPVFQCKVKQIWPPKIVGKSHLKLYIEEDGHMLEGIGFGMADRRSELLHKGLLLDIAFTPQINTFQSKASIQLNVKDFRVRGA